MHLKKIYLSQSSPCRGHCQGEKGGVAYIWTLIGHGIMIKRPSCLRLDQTSFEGRKKRVKRKAERERERERERESKKKV